MDVFALLCGSTVRPGTQVAHVWTRSFGTRVDLEYPGPWARTVAANVGRATVDVFRGWQQVFLLGRARGNQSPVVQRRWMDHGKGRQAGFGHQPGDTAVPAVRLSTTKQSGNPLCYTVGALFPDPTRSWLPQPNHRALTMLMGGPSNRSLHREAHPADDQKAKRVPSRMVATYGRLMDALFSVVHAQVRHSTVPGCPFMSRRCLNSDYATGHRFRRSTRTAPAPRMGGCQLRRHSGIPLGPRLRAASAGISPRNWNAGRSDPAALASSRPRTALAFCHYRYRLWGQARRAAGGRHARPPRS